MNTFGVHAFGCDARGYVKDSHVSIFLEATAKFHAYILVRNTGVGSLSWAGQRGYTAKRADMKCKTANQEYHVYYKLNGLVCSPDIHFRAFKDDRLKKAREVWAKSQPLITNCSFTNEDWPKQCRTPYLMQTNLKHRHYGVVAYIETGITSPRYVHGDYDLFAIVHESSVATREVVRINYNQGSVPSALPLQDQLALSKPLVMDSGPLLFRLMNHLDREFGYPMVMHAEDENRRPEPGKNPNEGQEKSKEEQVIVFLPPLARHSGRGGVMFLENNAQIETFYAIEFRGRHFAWQSA
jgi:hypothetical protein